jgi:hypothetical protein
MPPEIYLHKEEKFDGGLCPPLINVRGATRPLTTPQNWLERLAGRAFGTPRKPPLPAKIGNLSPKRLDILPLAQFFYTDYNILMLRTTASIQTDFFPQQATGNRQQATGNRQFCACQVPGSLNFPFFINSVPQNTPPAKDFDPKSLDSALKSLDFTSKSLDFKPKSLNSTPKSFDFKPASLDFNPRSLDFTLKSLDFKPKSLDNVVFWDKNVSFLSQMET